MFIDIHCHILPGVDDGAESYEESLDMLRQASESGTDIVVATPHFHNKYQCTVPSDRNYIIEKYRKLKKMLSDSGIPMSVYLGSEILCSSANIDIICNDKNILTMNGSRYILVEFDFNENPAIVRYLLEKLIAAEYIPVIAHPERYKFLISSPYEAFEYKKIGCLFQINKGSPVNVYGKESTEYAKWLLRENLVSFIASDCHSPYQRTPDMSEIYEWLLMNDFSEKYIKKILYDNPKLLLKGLPTV